MIPNKSKIGQSLSRFQEYINQLEESSLNNAKKTNLPESDYDINTLSPKELEIHQLINNSLNSSNNPQANSDTPNSIQSTNSSNSLGNNPDQSSITNFLFIENINNKSKTLNTIIEPNIPHTYIPHPKLNMTKQVPNITTNKKDLKFHHQELERITLEQNVEHPQLSMNLINIVQNPGIYPLSEVKKMNPDTNLHLFDKLPTPEMINFESLDTYMRPHEDPNLRALLKHHKLKYSSSTSGISETLAHFFYKLSNFKSPHFYGLSSSYADEPLKFMMFQRKPSSIVVHKLDKGNYALSKNSLFASKDEFILLKMGKYMEKIFTSSPDEFKERYMKNNKSGSATVDLKDDDFFNFVKYDKFLLRSQIDCGGKDINGNDIVFEIKTRAVAPIRYDVENYLDYLDYSVDTLQGRHSSYEREYYDLIRGAFLKYMFQLKIGGMSGAFISYHNTDSIYGFEYVPLIDMERRLFGNPGFADMIFKACLKLLQEVLDVILRDFPDENKIIIGFFANEWKGTLDAFVEQVDDDSYSDIDGFNDPIDYFYTTGYSPRVHKYTIEVSPILNDVYSFSPILYEKNDSYNVSYRVIYNGKPTFADYMQFVHESHGSKESTNLQSQYTGTWISKY